MIERAMVPYQCVFRYEVEATFCDGATWFSHNGELIEWDDDKLAYDFVQEREVLHDEP